MKQKKNYIENIQKFLNNLHKVKSRNKSTKPSANEFRNKRLTKPENLRYIEIIMKICKCSCKY